MTAKPFNNSANLYIIKYYPHFLTALRNKGTLAQIILATELMKNKKIRVSFLEFSVFLTNAMGVL